MLRSLYTSASGMLANQLYVDSISNNLANVNTTGYKKSKIEFQDLLYQTMVEPGSSTSDGVRLPGSLQVGLGVKTAGNVRSFEQGSLLQTGNPLDIAIQGDGFFLVKMPDQTNAFTRDGSFKVNADGLLVNADGHYLDPQIQIPENSSNLVIGPDGRISVTLQGDDRPTEVGQIELATFVNPAGLRSIGQNLYQSTEASGPPATGVPGENGSGALASQYLEGSNVQLVDEMVALIVAQRAYEISSKSITVSDEMLQNANNLKR
ncbi:MAG: flagellar basal-body rod protein FlgG [Fibrobacteria bacterium]|nr:flagellar basal-body rod protein FlgG [Fibrobacteria bacterium]